MSLTDCDHIYFFQMILILCFSSYEFKLYLT